MADTFEPSSGTDPLFADRPKQQDLSGNITDPLFADRIAEQNARVQAGARWSQKFDPETYSKASKLLPGLDPEVTLRQLPTVEKMKKLSDLESVFAKAPAVRDYYAARPKDLAYTNADELDNLSGLAWIFEAGPAAAESGMNMIRASQARLRLESGLATIQDKAFLANYENDRTFGGTGFLSGAFVGAAQQIAPVIGTIGFAGLGALQGFGYGSTAGAVGGSVFPGIGTAAGAAFGGSSGAAVGARYGAIQFQADLQRGLSLIELDNVKDDLGRGLEPEAKSLASYIVGYGGALLEMTAMEQFISVLPGADRIKNFFTAKGMTEALKVPAVASAFTAFAKNFATTMGTEITTEVAQQGLQIIAEEVLKANADGNFEQRTAGEIAQELGSAAYSAAQVMTLMGGFAAGTRLGADLTTMARSKRNADKLKSAAARVADNGFVQRNPEQAAAVIDAQMGDRKVYLPADEVQVFFQTQTQDEGDVQGPAIPNWRDRLNDALSTGGDLELTMGEFLAHLASNPKNQPLLDLARVDPRDFITKDIQEFSDGFGEFLKSEIATAEAGTIQRFDPEVRTALSSMIQTSDPTVGEAVAATIGSYLETRARQLTEAGTPTTPMDLFNEFGPVVQMQAEALSNTIRNPNGTAQSLIEYFQSAYHGSPNIFDNFDLKFLNTGEGAQVFGWGLYFAQNERIADKQYRERLVQQRNPRRRTVFVDGVEIDQRDTAQDFARNRILSEGSKIKAEARLVKEIRDLVREVDLTEEELAEFEVNPQSFMDMKQRQFPNVRHWKLEDSTRAALEKNVSILKETLGWHQQAYALLANAKNVEVRTTGGLPDPDSPEGLAIRFLREARGDRKLAAENLKGQRDMGGAFGWRNGGASWPEGKKAFELLESGAKLPDVGRLFRVNLPEDPQLLIWDVGLSEQATEVQEMLINAGVVPDVRGALEAVRADEYSMSVAELKERSVDGTLTDFENGALQYALRTLGEPDDTQIYFYENDPDSLFHGVWSVGNPAQDETLLNAFDIDADPTGEAIYRGLVEKFDEWKNANGAFGQTVADVRATEATFPVSRIQENLQKDPIDVDWELMNIYHKLVDQGVAVSRAKPESLVYTYNLAPEGMKDIQATLGASASDDMLIGWGAIDTTGLDFDPRKRSDQLASEKLRELGILGHKFLDGNTRGHDNITVRWPDPRSPTPKDVTRKFKTRGEAQAHMKRIFGMNPGEYQIEDNSSFNFVIYDDKAIEVLEYFQEQKGSITFQKDAQAVIRLFAKGDISTLLHESSHFFLETTKTLAAKSPAIAAEWEHIKKQLQVGEDNALTRDQHEQFARWGEAYFFEGKAPTPELRSVFQTFKRWLRQIYRSIKAIGGAVSPEVSQIFDRMLGADARFDAVASEPSYKPVFNSAEEMGVSPEDYLEYQRLVEDLREAAQDAALGRIVGQQKKLSSGWRKEILGQLTQEAEAKLLQTPPYLQLDRMKQKGFSIDKELLEGKSYSSKLIKRLPSGVVQEDGLDPDVAAEILGYPAADDLFYDILQAPPIKTAARELAEQEMIARYGDDFRNQELMDLAVQRAFAEDGRVTLLAKEYKALSAKAGRTVSEAGPKQLAKEIARRNLYTKKVKDVRERVTQAAVRRAARMADAAIVKGDWNTAADWKRKQLLAQAIDNETQELNRRFEKIRDKGAKYTRTKPKGIDPSAMEQIRDLVTKYEFAKVPLRKLARRERVREMVNAGTTSKVVQDPSVKAVRKAFVEGQAPGQTLREFMDRAQAEGLVTKIPDYLLKQASVTNYKELTVEQLLQFSDALDNLEHLGRMKHKLRTAKDARDFAAVQRQVLNQLETLPPRKVKMKTLTEEQIGLGRRVADYAAILLKPEQIIEFLDAGEIAGPMNEFVFEPMAQAQARQNEMMAQYTKRVMEIFDGIESGYLQQIVTVSSIRGPGGKPGKFTREEVFAVALNVGNESNRTKLLEGEAWTENQLTEILSHMTKDDWDKVQKIWNTLETLWDKIAALEKRLTGVAPPRIEAKEVITPHGTYEGGYYPVIYDFKARRGLALIEDITPADKRPNVDSIELWGQNFNMTPGTNHTHTYARQKIAKPIRRSLSVLPGHIHDVVHDLTYREPVRTAYRILWDAKIKQGIIDAEGEAVYDQLTFWLRAIATQHSLKDESGAEFFRHLRTGTSIFAMGWRITTSLAQILGIGPTLAEVGAKFTFPALYQMSRHPFQTLELVNSLSTEMRDRFNNHERDIREAVQQVTKKKGLPGVRWVKKNAFVLIAALDKYVATVTWLAGYNKYLMENPGAQDLARQSGDRLVRLTQGSGYAKDMAKVMNSTELLKLMTMFYSAFSGQYNRGVALTRRTKHDISEGEWNKVLTEDLPSWLYLVVFPAILGALMSGQGPEEDENVFTWALRKTLFYPMAMIPIARDMVGPIESTVAGVTGGKRTGFQYTMSPAARAVESTVRSITELTGGDFAGAIKPTATALSIAFKIPSSQAISSFEALWVGLREGDLEWPQDLILGRRDK